MCLRVRLRDLSKGTEITFAGKIDHLTRSGFIDFSLATSLYFEIVHCNANRHLFRGSSDNFWWGWLSWRRAGDDNLGI